MNGMTDTLAIFADQVTSVSQGGRHRRQARRPGRGAERVGHLEGPHRLGEPDGVEPDQPGPQHRAGHDRGGRGRPDPEGHGRRQGRDPRAEEHRQHDGRPAVLVRGRGHARRARGRHRGQARRPGRGQGGVRHMARAHRVGEPDGRQPDGSGALDRAGVDGGRRGRPLAEDRGRGQGRGGRARGHHQQDGRPAALVRRRGHARGARRSAPRASWAARPRSRTSPGPGAGSPRTSTRWPRT